MAANQNINEIRRDLMLGLKEVSNEATGFIQSVNTSTGAETAAIGDDIKVPVGTAGDVIDTPVGFNPPTDSNSDVDAVHMAITKSKTVTIDWNGENESAVMNSGALGTVLAQQFADAFRSLRNIIEVDTYNAAVQGASRAYGTAGTTPFATKDDMSDLANLQGILDANGCSETNRTVVLSPAAKINLLSKQMNMIKVNESGSADTLRNGIIMPTYGFNVRSSFGCKKIAGSSASGYLINGANIAEGAESVSIDTGSGTINAGDIVTIAGDDNKYVAGEGSTTTKLVLNPRGLLVAPADNAEVTVGATAYTASVAFHKNAIALAIRPPRTPRRGDSAIGRTYVTDPLTNITYEIAVYAGQRIVQYQVSVAWGVKAINGEHIALLLG